MPPVLAMCLVLGACERPALVFSKETGTESPAAVPEEKLSFNTHIQPILSEYCYHCHGPDAGTREPQSEPLRLDLEQEAFSIREDGRPVIVKGDPDASLLVRLIRSKDSDVMMPPPASHKELDEEKIALLERWVVEGAEYEEHWAFVAPVRPSVPEGGEGWVRNPVDSFIHAGLAAKGLEPSPAENTRALARRAALDLTGLLADPAEVEALAGNPSDAAYEAFLEKLFSTQAYAEHRARYWLDYSRYADTHGLHFDNVRSIWPYRDYVIRSFAEHKRYDRFVREQLAGDLIAAESAEEWIATGYIRCNVSTNEGGTIPEEIHVDKTRDRTEAFGATFLGLTVGCAACHDHKFDPVSQKDFFALSAFFNNTAEKSWDDNIADSQPVLRLPEEGKRAELDGLVTRRAKAAAKYEELRGTAGNRFAQWLAAGNSPSGVAADGLKLRLRLDEGKGETVLNSAPGAATASYTADTNPILWDESIWLWPAMRLDLAGKLTLPDQGDFEADQSFSVGLWTRLRQKTGGGNSGTGAVIARMGRSEDQAHRGWDMLVNGDKLVVHIINEWPAHAIRVETAGVPRGEWTHLGFSYDGSSSAGGVKLFVNGESRPVTILNDTLEPGQTIRTALPMNLGRRHESDLLRETAFQDVRVYHRRLDEGEFARLPYEDPASEILSISPESGKWAELERHLIWERFFLGSKDAEAAGLRAEINELDQQIHRLGEGGTPTLIAREGPGLAHAWVLDRGVYSARTELVFPGTPKFLPSLPDGEVPGRLALAEWLFSEENPLFARVTVNRIWQEIFGTGLVDTPDDFGIMGNRPVNPELLDWLAVEFRESGWDVKHMYKLLLTSATYRQSQEVTQERLEKDPDNRLLSRGPRFRMDGEVLRDTALQASGLLADRVGGPPVKPYQPEGIWEAVSMPESNTLKYQQDKGEALYRRSLYIFWKRFAPPPSLETFDAQAREVVCVRRARTNTPLQALVSMNDPQFVEAARKLAERAILHASDAEARIHFMAEILLSRPLDEEETAGMSRSLAIYEKHYRDNPQDALDLLGTGEAPSNPDLDPTETAAWTMVANQLLNLDETLTK